MASHIRSKKMILGAGLVILVLLGAGFTMGIYSLKTMREVVSDQFNKQQLVLAEQAARQIEDQLQIVIQELSILNQSSAIQQLDEGRWSNRIEITQAVVRKLGVTEIGRVDSSGTKLYSVDVNEEARISPRHPKYPKEVHSWASLPENQGKIKVIKEPLSAGSLPGRSLVMLALPTYRDTVNKTHSGRTFAGYLYGLVDREQLVGQVVKGIRSGASGYGWAIDDLFTPNLVYFIGKIFEERFSLNFNRFRNILGEGLLLLNIPNPKGEASMPVHHKKVPGVVLWCLFSALSVSFPDIPGERKGPSRSVSWRILPGPGF